MGRKLAVFVIKVNRLAANYPKTSGSDKNDRPRAVVPTAKETAKQVIDRLPDQASWEDILYELYVTQKIEAGLAATGKIAAHQEAVRSAYPTGLSPNLPYRAIVSLLISYVPE